MTERAVTVQPGRVTPLGDTLPAGTSIFNLDPVNAIWVSNNPGVVPGQGAKIGAYGSILWQGGACYAVPDTGVLAPVNLTLSDQAISPVNPVDVATATANQLALQGIPAVLQGSLIYSKSLTGLGTSFTVPVDVSKYANLSIYLSVPGGGNPQVWTVAHYDSKTFSRLYAKSYVQAASTTGGIALDTTPRGDQVSISWTQTVGSVIISVYATNRTMPERVINTDNYFFASLSNQAMPQFTSIVFPGTFSTAGGLHNVAIEIGGTNNTTAKGFVQVAYLDAGGASRTLTVCAANVAGNGPAGETFFQGLVNLPAGVYSFVWVPGNVTTSTNSVNLFITAPSQT